MISTNLPNKINTYLFVFIAVLTISACSSLPRFTSLKPTIPYNETNHQQYLKQLNNWQVTGKIAVINDESRESASLFWQHQPDKKQEKLALTTYLGIRILSIERTKKKYQLSFENQVQQHHDLEFLLWSVSGFQLPTNALRYWLKGLPYSRNDRVTYMVDSIRPNKIISQYKGLTWDITYQSYTEVDGIPLPNRISIRQDNVVIKLAINQWTL